MPPQSPPSPSPWTCLEALPGLIALPCVWRARLGAQFDQVQALILQDNSTPAQLLPCPRGCGHAHDIVHRPNGSIFATCHGDSSRPREIPLTRADIIPLEVSRTKLGRVLCEALGLERKVAALPPPNTLQFGAWSAGLLPAILTIQVCCCAFRRVVAELVARQQGPFLLFAPTSNHFDAPCQELLAHARAGFFALDATVLLTAHGTLQPVQPPAALFARFSSHPDKPSAIQNSPVQGSTVQSSTVQSSAVQSSAVQSSAVQGSAVQGSAVQGSTVQGSAVQGSTVQGSAVQSSPVRSSPVQGSTVQGSTVQGSPVRSPPPPYSLLRQPACWRLTFDGCQTTLPHGLGILYIFHMLMYPSVPAPAARLAAKIQTRRHRKAGLAGIPNPEGGIMVPDEDSVIEESVDKIGDSKVLRTLRRQHAELEAAIDSEQASEPEKAEAQRDLEQNEKLQQQYLRRFQDTAQKAAEAVRRAIYRFVDALRTPPPGRKVGDALCIRFADHLEEFLLIPSRRYSGHRARIARADLAGCLIYEPPPGTVWVG